jgi:hypothetical protein
LLHRFVQRHNLTGSLRLRTHLWNHQKKKQEEMQRD